MVHRREIYFLSWKKKHTKQTHFKWKLLMMIAVQMQFSTSTLINIVTMFKSKQTALWIDPMNTYPMYEICILNVILSPMPVYFSFFSVFIDLILMMTLHKIPFVVVVILILILSFIVDANFVMPILNVRAL